MSLVTAYWRTNLTLRQLGPLFGVSKPAADRIIDHHLGPSSPSSRVGGSARTLCSSRVGTLVPTRDHTVAEQSKNYRYSTNHQVVIDADTRLVVGSADRCPAPAHRGDALGVKRCRWTTRRW